ncbi:hypothetical protein [Sphingomonas sp. KR3-1]|uniref:DUF6980 family protein n=1 Tax=Sphingomonas sp. KR3-1 TaxID=3156611 RepID=UPI0032B4A104
MMRSNVERTCDAHPDRYDCPDCLVDYSARRNLYGLMIRNEAGGGMVTIQFCPWCGTKLPEAAND